MTIEVDTVTAPAYWASYLVNEDASGLDDDERRAADRWLADLAPWRVVATIDDAEPRFTWSFRLYGGESDGGDVIDYIVHRTALP